MVYCFYSSKGCFYSRVAVYGIVYPQTMKKTLPGKSTSLTTLRLYLQQGETIPTICFVWRINGLREYDQNYRPNCWFRSKILKQNHLRNSILTDFSFLLLCRADDLSSDMCLQGLTVQSLHGDREQCDREEALQDFRDGMYVDKQ